MMGCKNKGKKGKKSQQQKPQPAPEPSPEPEPEPEMDEDMDMDMAGMGDMMGAEDSGPLFWSMKVEANQTIDIDQPAIPNYIVHITNACFGAKVNPKSRSVVTVTTTNEDEDGTAEGVPICVLREGQQENQSLDLLFNESASLTVTGTKPSTVYLTGYIQPPVNGADDLDAMNPMMEDMDEEQIMEALKEQKRQQMALDDEDEEVSEPATKSKRPPKDRKRPQMVRQRRTKRGRLQKETALMTQRK